MEMMPVQSSNVSSIGYQNGCIYVQFHSGAVYQRPLCPSAFEAAPLPSNSLIAEKLISFIYYFTGKLFTHHLFTSAEETSKPYILSAMSVNFYSQSAVNLHFFSLRLLLFAYIMIWT